jgi:hypothetical protein
MVLKPEPRNLNPTLTWKSDSSPLILSSIEEERRQGVVIRYRLMVVGGSGWF